VPRTSDDKTYPADFKENFLCENYYHGNGVNLKGVSGKYQVLEIYRRRIFWQRES
jgi:hypothetical protein